MKTRYGFVSNSSSSSFIVGVAEIVDKAKFDAYIEEHNIALDNAESYETNASIVTESDDRWDVRFSLDEVRVISFDTSVSVERKEPGTIYFVTNINNDEGDGPFWNDEYCEMEYDITPDYFDGKQRKVYDMFSDVDSGLNMENQVAYGAARNG